MVFAAWEAQIPESVPTTTLRKVNAPIQTTLLSLQVLGAVTNGDPTGSNGHIAVAIAEPSAPPHPGDIPGANQTAKPVDSQPPVAKVPVLFPGFSSFPTFSSKPVMGVNFQV
jgi:hypothetical protein